MKCTMFEDLRSSWGPVAPRYDPRDNWHNLITCFISRRSETLVAQSNPTEWDHTVDDFAKTQT